LYKKQDKGGGAPGKIWECHCTDPAARKKIAKDYDAQNAYKDFINLNWNMKTVLKELASRIAGTMKHIRMQAVLKSGRCRK